MNLKSILGVDSAEFPGGWDVKWKGKKERHLTPSFLTLSTVYRVPFPEMGKMGYCWEDQEFSFGPVKVDASETLE